MNRRAVLVAVGSASLGISGCLNLDLDGRNDRTEERIRTVFRGEPERPRCEKEHETIEVERDDGTKRFETAATIPYPESPSAFDEGALVEFVEDFDHAYVTHDVLCNGGGSGEILSIYYRIQKRETFDWYNTITVVYLLRMAGALSGTTSNGNLWAAEIAPTGVVYAVDETGLVRAEDEETKTLNSKDLEANAPNPLQDGELVAVFE